MFNKFTVSVVVPCYNEETLIRQVVETMPEFVDRIYIIDDNSNDNTVEIVQDLVKTDPSRISLLRHHINQGVGGAIATGYKAALNDDIDITAVMAGDAQMDPTELVDIIAPIAKGECDYTKGNRLFSGDAWNIIPRVRFLGNSMLSLLTKIASGYWHIADSQSGYTAISLKALRTIDWDSMYKQYGQPNDLLVRLNIHNFKVKDVPITPVYGVGEKSGIKPIRMIPKLWWLLFKLFWYRMLHKYVIRDFHPLLFFYSAASILIPAGTLLGTYLFAKRILVGPVAETSALFSAFLLIMGMQFLFFGMWLDMEYNKDLK